MIYLAEFHPVDPATGETVVLRFASAGYTTAPGDTPANAHFRGRLQNPGQYDRFLFSRGARARSGRARSRSSTPTASSTA